MPIEIEAAVQRQAGEAPRIESLTIDDPRPGEVLVEIRAVGICHTDLILSDGGFPMPMPVVLGHEGAGVVRQVGADVSDLKPGDHVVLTFDSCGTCSPCGGHEPAYCLQSLALNLSGSRADGTTALHDELGQDVHSHVFGQSSFASHAITHRRNAVRVAQDIPFETLAPLGCGIMTGAGTILNALKVRPGSSVAVIGAGAVGMAAIMAARLVEADRIVAIDVHENRIALATELGATDGLNAHDGPLAEQAARIGMGGGFDYIVDTSGISDVCGAAIDALAPRGELALVAVYPPGKTLSIDPSFMMTGGRRIRGVVAGDADMQEFIPQLIEHHRRGRFPFDRLIDHFKFSQIADALRAAREGRVIKPVLVP